MRILKSIKFPNKSARLRAVLILALMLALVSLQASAPAAAVAKNSWRGITPLHSSADDVARAIGVEAASSDDLPTGPFAVEGGEVTFSYLTPSLARIYRAPASMVGKVFTIYFNPVEPIPRDEVKLAPGFKRCFEEFGKSYYYFVSDAGIAYRLRRDKNDVEMIIYQPTRAEVRRLAVNTECVF